jgi:cytochrome c oxidase cbb3-type subunit 4
MSDIFQQWVYPLWQLWLFILFVAIVAWVFWPSHKKQLEKHGEIPLRDDDPSRQSDQEK